MKAFQIVCPECKGVNTLELFHDKHRSYIIEAIPSPSKQSRGTFQLLNKPVDTYVNRKTVCTSCGWSKDGWPVVSDIVREIPGDA